MKSLISVNKKFMEVSPKDLFDIILKYKHTKGIEACFDFNNPIEMKYLDDLVFEVSKNNFCLQIHADSKLSLEDQIKYMNKLSAYSDLLGYPIVVTIHSAYDPDKELSLKKTVEYLGELVKNIDNNKIVIALENLDDSKDKDRLEREYITSTILNNDNVYFTYDIGHELFEYGDLTNLNKYLIEEIRNIHLHTYNFKKNHQPIYENDPHWNEMMKALIFLINSNYSGNITYEYDLYDCRGESISDKINDFLESIDLVSEKYI